MKAAKILIGICTCHEYSARQEAVRSTWMGCLPENATAVLFLGEGGEVLNKDTILLPAPDDYTTLRQKVHAFCRHAVSHFDFDYLFKCDDDTYVVANRLKHLLFDSPDLVGSEEWAHEGFCSGGAGYLLSKRATEIIARTQSSEIAPEDVWVSRILQQSGIKMQTSGQLQTDIRRFPTPDNCLISAHYCSPEIMRQIHCGFDRSFGTPNAQSDTRVGI